MKATASARRSCSAPPPAPPRSCATATSPQMSAAEKAALAALFAPCDARTHDGARSRRRRVAPRRDRRPPDPPPAAPADGGAGAPRVAAPRHEVATGRSARRRLRLDELLRRRSAAARPPVASAGRTNVEVFTMGTRLTHVTRAMRQRDPDRALVAAGDVVPGLVGRHPARRVAQGVPRPVGAARDGPRRGRRHLQRRVGARRGAELLDEQMRRLRSLAHRVVWVNPHRGKAGYQPIQQGIVAALPHCRRPRGGALAARPSTRLAEVVDHA